jgi:hypothetical protein
MPRVEETVGPRRVLDERFRRLWPDDHLGPAYFTDEGYRLTARTPGQFVAIRAPVATLAADLSLTGTFRKVGGPPGGGYGFVLRHQAVGAGDGVDQTGQYVVAAAGDHGEIGVWRRDGNRWLDLVPWSPSAAVQPGPGTNELAARVTAGRLTFAINGVQVADVPIGLQAGGVGLFVGGDFNEVLVRQLVVDEVPGSRPVIAADATALLAAKEREVAAAGARLATLSGKPKLDAGVAEAGWRASAADSVAELQRVGQEVEFAFGDRKATAAQATRVRDLMGSIAEDVTALTGAFADGFDGPRSPVTNPTTLADASARLKSASAKAELVRAELEAMRNGAVAGVR